MKTFKLLLAFTILLGIVYYQLDRDLFFFGRDDLNIYNLLPLQIKPDYRPDFEGGFVLRDKDGFSIASDRDLYRLNKKTIITKKFLKYGFDKEHLIAVFSDSNQASYCVKYTKAQTGRYYLDMCVDSGCRAYNFNSYKWVVIDGNEAFIFKLWVWRNRLMFIIIFLIIVLGYMLIRFMVSGASTRI